MCSRTVILGATAKIIQTCVLFSIFQLVCQIEKWLDDPKQSRTINYRRTFSHYLSFTNTRILQKRRSKSEIDCFKFSQTDLYLLHKPKSMSVPLSWIKSVFLWPQNLCMCLCVCTWCRDEDIFQNITDSTTKSKMRTENGQIQTIQLLIDFYKQNQKTKRKK